VVLPLLFILTEHCQNSQNTCSCLECEEKFCDNCFELNHVSLKKKTHKKSDFDNFIPQPCEKHSNKNKDYYCQNDNEILCSTCAFDEKHKGHKIQHLKEAFFERQKNYIQKLKENEVKMENEINEKSKEIQKISDEFEKQKKIFEQELNKLDKEKDEKLLKLKEIQNLKKITEDALDYSLVLNMKEILEVPEIQISIQYLQKEVDFIHPNQKYSRKK
jgi:hypothetical protein